MFKRARIVMLPTNEKAKIHQHSNGSLYQSISEFVQASQAFSSFHLYILSDEEIEEGDWYLYPVVKGSAIKQYSNQEHFSQDSSISLGNLKARKIIATTDNSLSLSSISKSFIELYIEQYNKGNVIESVEVEYEEYTIGSYGLSLDHEPTIDIRLKINSDNTINIRSIKDSWNREEILQLLIKFKCDLEKPSDIKSWTPIEEWLNLNL